MFFLIIKYQDGGESTSLQNKSFSLKDLEKQSKLT